MVAKIWLLMALAGAALLAQEPAVAQTEVAIPKIDRAPRLEEFLDMKLPETWSGKLAAIRGFVQREPSDGQPSVQLTEVYLGYDEKNLYVIYLCFDTERDKIRARLSRREDVFDDDNVELMLDTFHDHRRSYAFFANAVGIQADALWTEGSDFDFSFDTVWDSDSKLTDRGYVVRMAIPFRSLRFSNADPQTWGIMFARQVPRINEQSFWPQYSSRIQGRLNQEGDAHGLEHISPGRNIQLIPYGLFRSFKELDLRDPDIPEYTQRQAFGQVGLDAKVVLKDKFVLDMTANPDFSQVESDDPQVTVNQRFEVFFPEKRPFFLENANYFITPANLVFTRRIVDPKWGVRLTGKNGPWALGLLVADDASPGQLVPKSDPTADKHAYFAIGRVSRDIGSQSTLGAIFTDREFDGSFNRVGGLDGRVNINSNWVADFQGVISSTLNTDGTYQAGPLWVTDVVRQGRKLNYELHFNDRSNGFHTEPGFDPQPDLRQVDQVVRYSFRPEGKHLISWGPVFETYHGWDHEGNKLYEGYFPQMRWELVGQTFLSLLYAREAELLRPQDFSVLTTNRQYRRHTSEVSLDTAIYGPVILHADYRWGTRVLYDAPVGEAPYLAGRTSANVTVTVRPNRFLKIDNTYLWFRLHDRLSSAGIFNNHIIRSKWNYQFNPRLSLRFIGEYNSVLANPVFTSLQTTKNFNADFLITYLVHPSTALYVGYNSNLENVLTPLGADADGNLLRGPRFVNDGRNFFVKASYLFRF